MVAECVPHNTDNTVGVLSLEMSAPSQYPAGQELDVPVLVTNTSDSTLNNVVYSIPTASNTTGSTLTITDASQASCATLASGQMCQLTVHIVPNSVMNSNNTTKLNTAPSTILTNNAGTFKVLAHNNSLNAEQSVFIGLVNVPASSGIGVDGITLLYNNTIMGSASCKLNAFQNVLITMVVTSQNVGSFNTLSIVDSNGNTLPYEVLTGNSGEGMTNLTIGNVVTLAVKVPCGSTQLVFEPVLKSNNNIIENGTGTNPDVIDIVPPTVKKAILNVLPTLVDLNESTPTEIITVVNSGNASASSLNVSMIDPQVTVNSNSCVGSLAAGASCSYNVSFDVAQPVVGTTTSNVSYNDSKDNQNLSVTVNYRGKTPVVGLTLSSNNLNYEFNATTESPTVTSIVTITNAGAVLPLTLASWSRIANFSISTAAGTGNDCIDNQVLTPGDSCNILVTYNNPVAGSGIEMMSIGFTYLDIDSTTQSGSSSTNLNYSTIQSVAVLSYDNALYSFGGIVDNGVASSQRVVTIMNIGQVAATNINVASLAQPYNLISNGCGATLASGASCQLTVGFGPVTSSAYAGTESSNLPATYLPYASATVGASLNANLIGFVALAQTAVLNTAITESSGFIAGTGSFASPLQVQQSRSQVANAQQSNVQQQVGGNSQPTITYTLTNDGAVPANQFYVSYDNSVLLPWRVIQNNCGTQQSKITLASGSTCTIVFALNPSNVGSNNLNMNNIHMNWVDEDSPNGQTQNGTELLYVNVFAAPTIATQPVPSPIGTLIQNMPLHIMVTLNGGYNVQPQTVTGTISNDTNNDLTTSTSSCQVSSESASCIMTFKVKANPITESSVGVSIADTTSVIRVSPNYYQFDIAYNTQPFYVAPVSPKVGESFNFSPTFTSDAPSATNPYTVTLPAGITTDDGSSSYQMTSNLSTRRLKVLPNTSAGLYPITMTDSYGNTFTTYLPVAVLQKMLYFADGTGIFSCRLNSDGTINGTCGLNSAVTDDTSVIGINSTGTYAYVGGRMSRISSTRVKICQVSSAESTYGQLNNCQYFNGLTPGFIQSNGILVGALTNTQQTKLYVGATSSGGINICDITPNNPVPTNCSLFNIPNATSINRMTFNYNGTQLITSDSTTLHYCSVNADGSISGCTTSPTVMPSPNITIGVSFSYDNTKLFSVGYTGTNSGNNPWAMYTSYSMNNNTFGSSFSNGLLNNISGSYPYLTGVAFGPNYAYMAAIGSPTLNGGLTCTLSVDGLLNQCTPISRAIYSGSSTDGLNIFN